MLNNKKLILVSNDDGITAPGISFLVGQMVKLGDVIVVAPNKPQSGMSHAITLSTSLKIFESKIFEHFDNVKAYETTGTPADCIKIARFYILKNKKPDLVVTGINHGNNASINVLYSGTMAGAIEGATDGIPSIGFSLYDFDWEINFDHIKSYLLDITKKVLDKGIPKHIALNINFPEQRGEAIKGVKICQQAKAKWIEEFVEERDSEGKQCFWMTGNFINEDKSENSDIQAIKDNYISIVPVQYDLTHFQSIELMKKIFL